MPQPLVKRILLVARLEQDAIKGQNQEKGDEYAEEEAQHGADGHAFLPFATTKVER